jgi:DNA-binding NtrC family response regulator
MSTLEIQFEPLAVAVSTTTNALRVVLADGRELSVPLAWFPRLKNATEKQRSQWRLIGGGIGIHWPLVDEDISVESLLARPQLARRSGIISLTEMEKRAIREALEYARGDRAKAADILGIGRTTLSRKLKAHRLAG